MKTLLRLTLLILLIATSARAEISSWQEITPSFSAGKIRLLSTAYTNEMGEEKLLLGLHLKLKKGWKIYGRDSSGVGLAPSIEFLGYQQYTSHKIFWPKSILQEEKIGDTILKYSIYKNEVILPIETDLKADSDLDLKLNYGICKEICIPATAEFSIFIQDQIDPEAKKLIESSLHQEQKNSSGLKKSSITLATALVTAFIGGLILNFMPCVLPVLGVKVISIISHSRTNNAAIRLAFFSTILGIFACFVLFSLFAVSISAAGNVFNWGVQFQNPYFIIFLIVILLFFAANMLGFFEIGISQILSNSIDKKVTKAQKKNNIFIANFLSGVLAVLLATPCSAPFLGTAISFSITQVPIDIFAIFLMIAFGLASPYFILLIWPKSIYFLPKSGAWTQKIKNIMAIFLILTVFWLIYVLLGNVGLRATFVTSLIAFFIFLSFAIGNKALKFTLIFILLALMSFLPMQMQGSRISNQFSDGIWRRFDEEKISEYVNDGKTVVIDVTANWCLTCKFNKYRVLESPEVKNILAQEGIIAMRADITAKNQAAIDFINNHGRYAIPFNAVFGPNAPEGLLTSELLTKKELLGLIKAAQE